MLCSGNLHLYGVAIMYTQSNSRQVTEGFLGRGSCWPLLLLLLLLKHQNPASQTDGMLTTVQLNRVANQ